MARFAQNRVFEGLPFLNVTVDGFRQTFDGQSHLFGPVKDKNCSRQETRRDEPMLERFLNPLEPQISSGF
jgi:hypothetical protein